jgi:carbamoylphosphate synthase small subunit
MAQMSYCGSTLTPYECVVDRGCKEYYVAEAEWDQVEIWAGPGDPCGNDNHGGERCKANCCATQESYCMETLTRYECIVDRDCNDHYVAETPCDQVEIRAGPGDPCGNDKHGGERCKENCCAAQVRYCLDTSTQFECIVDRDCNDHYVAETPCDQVEIRAGPGDPCGNDKHRGERCKAN